jgi:prepilin-type N-terminal cleavage/methylation domain-containing protein
MRKLPTSRPGFTLIELLVVIGIISVLVIITVAGALRGYQWILRRNSELTLQKVAERMQRRYELLIKEARALPTPPLLLVQAAGNPRRAEVLKLKYLIKWSFPMNYVEAEYNAQESAYYLAPNGYPTAIALLNRLRVRQNPQLPAWSGSIPFLLPAPTTAAELNAQNAACLAAIFEIVLGTTADDLSPAESGLVGGTDGNRTVIDAWGTPLFFFRYGHLDLSWMAAHPEFAPLQAQYTALFGPSGTPPGPVGVYGQIYPELVRRAAQVVPGRFVPNPPFWTGNLPATSAGVAQTLDPDDMEGLLVLSWRTASGPWWRRNGGAPGPVSLQNQLGFQRTFGTVVPTSETARLFAPLVILSAGEDRNFATWDDNLDSYRFALGTAGQ